MGFHTVTVAAVQLMTFGDLHLKLPRSGGIYPNPSVQRGLHVHAQQTQARALTGSLARSHKLRKANNWERVGAGRQSEGKEQRRAGLVLSVSQMPRVCTVCTVSPHTSEPSVEATCLIMGNVCIWGKTVAGSS